MLKPAGPEAPENPGRDKIADGQSGATVADGVGFEPTVGFHLR